MYESNMYVCIILYCIAMICSDLTDVNTDCLHMDIWLVDCNSYFLFIYSLFTGTSTVIGRSILSAIINSVMANNLLPTCIDGNYNNTYYIL